MEIKAILNKPYTSKEKSDFIVENNHNKGYEIKEVAEGLEAWGLKNEEESEKELENKKASVRVVRNSYLEETDKYMLVDFPISEEERENYKGYRQYLRNYTDIQDWYEKFPLTFEEWKQTVIDSSDEVENV